MQHRYSAASNNKDLKLWQVVMLAASLWGKNKFLEGSEQATSFSNDG